jgi:hypothetical protein
VSGPLNVAAGDRRRRSPDQLRGRKPFRAFKDPLFEFTAHQTAWFAFKQAAKPTTGATTLRLNRRSSDQRLDRDTLGHANR